MTREELKKIIDESLNQIESVEELSPGIFWINSYDSYGLSLVDSQVYIYFSKGRYLIYTWLN